MPPPGGANCADCFHAADHGADGRFSAGFLCAFGSMATYFGTLAPISNSRGQSETPRTDRPAQTHQIRIHNGIVCWTGRWLDNLSARAILTEFAWCQRKMRGYPIGAWSVGALLLLLIIAGQCLSIGFFCRVSSARWERVCDRLQIPAFKNRKPRAQCGACRPARSAVPWCCSLIKRMS